MRYGRAIAGAAGIAAAGFAGSAIGSSYARRQQAWAQQIIAEDEHTLRSGQVLMPLPEPPEPKARTERSLVLWWVIGIVAGGVAAWLVTLLVLLGLIEASGQQAPLSERLISSQLFAFLAGLFGFVFPGIVIGALLSLRETQLRIKFAGATYRRQVWEQREQLRHGLATGQLTVPQAVAQLGAATDGTLGR